MTMIQRFLWVACIVWQPIGKFRAWGFSASSLFEQEKRLVEQQLGYLPTNFVRVSAYSSNKQPIAIQTYPLQGGAKRRQAKAATVSSSTPTVQSPFPTLYWLTSPEVSKCVGDLERRGFLQEIDHEISSDATLKERLWLCHRQYAEERWKSLSPPDRELLSEATDPALVSMRSIMKDSGISGSNLTITDAYVQFPAIKCLHAHYAHYRSTRDLAGFASNPVGERVHEKLILDFPDLDI